MESVEAFERVKATDWNNSIVSFFVVKRKLISRKANYEVLQVNIDDNLKIKLRDIVTNKINNSNNVFEYTFASMDLDDNLLTIPTSDTDLQKIIDTLLTDEEQNFASTFENLLGSWLYLARFDIEEQPSLFSVKRVSSNWTTKKVFQLINLVFRDNMLIDLSEKEIFRIDGNIDFISFNGTIFIADKNNFEIALNFREGMVRNRDDIVNEFENLNLFEDATLVSEFVGNNMRRLRKLSQVKKAGYYQDPEFLSNLKRVNEEENWSLQYSEDGKLIVTKGNIDDVLLFLNNDRLSSKINEENFNVDVKHKI